VLGGESFFVTMFTNLGQRRSDVAFSAATPGRVIPIDLKQWGGQVIAQKDSFLCAARGTNVSVALNRRIGAGLFGGEGFILQRVEGDGLAFLHASGTLVTIDLAPGEQLRVDTGCLVAMQPSVVYDIRTVPGIKTALFGGEGLFFVNLTGRGAWSCRRCRSRGSPTGSSPRRPGPAARGARRAGCSAASATC
jgi:uncharacterized protein (AIM24 family)